MRRPTYALITDSGVTTALFATTGVTAAPVVEEPPSAAVVTPAATGSVITALTGQALITWLN